MGVIQFVNEVVLKTANEMISNINNALDVAFLGGILFLLLAYPFYFLLTNLMKYTKERKGKVLLSHTLTWILIVLTASVAWIFPEFFWLVILDIFRKPVDIFSQWPALAWVFSSVRWAELLGVLYYAARRGGLEYGKNRWRESVLLSIGIITAGWFFYRWVGLIFISLPFLWMYNASLQDLALLVMPASGPEDSVEQKKRRAAFFSYTWGFQSPMIMVDDHAWKKYEPRIPGDITWDFADFSLPVVKSLDWRPGVIWTRPYHVVTITGGTKFKRVDGPGVVFTGKLERLDQIFDLRLQLRTKEIDVISKDGVHFLVRFFTPFRIDNEEWSQEIYDDLRQRNRLLRGGDKLTHEKGSFKFSTVRVQVTLGVTSTKAASGDPLIYWDQWAMNVVEDQTRQVISQKNLDEMWRPANDAKFKNALDTIATEIKTNCEPILRSAGILPYGARVVNFRFIPKPDAKPDEMDEISEQQIATWKSEWNRKREEILDAAKAEAERAQQEARAYAEAMLLNSIASGLKKANEINPQLPRYIIAMRFLSALQDYIHDQPADKQRIIDFQEVLQAWHEKFAPEE